jgi:hypothetical protein
VAKAANRALGGDRRDAGGEIDEARLLAEEETIAAALDGAEDAIGDGARRPTVVVEEARLEVALVLVDGARAGEDVGADRRRVDLEDAHAAAVELGAEGVAEARAANFDAQ